jgi:hypothetical protein
VVKISGNLAYDGGNASVIRNWPTLSTINKAARAGKSALYTGNLGYGHDVGSFVRTCDELRTEGYDIRVHGDGPGIRRLPSWIRAEPAFKSERELMLALESSEVHIVAAHPEIQGAVFPSKIWNSLASGARLVSIRLHRCYGERARDQPSE